MLELVPDTDTDIDGDGGTGEDGHSNSDLEA